MTPLPISPFVLDAERRFVLDEDAFMAEVEPLPSFLSQPRPEYITATEIMPIVRIIGGHAA